MGILDRLLGRSGRKAALLTMTAADAERIVNAYASATIEKRSFVADASGLPDSKATVKMAILAILSTNPDPPVRERLKLLYLSLADWQVGVGAKPLPLGPTQAGAANPQAARRGAAAGHSRTDVPARVATEAKSLRAELEARGH